MRSFLATLVLVASSSAAFAQAAKTPEQLLPADSLVFFRYDGYAAHRKAYEQTALAKAMNEGLHEFFDHAVEQMGALASDFPALNLKKEVKANPDVGLFTNYLWKHGIALSIEIAPPRRGRPIAEDSFQVTIVFPQGADKKNCELIDKLARQAIRSLNGKIEESKQAGRTVHIAALGAAQVGWWTEGDHLVLTMGVDAVQKAMRVMDGRRRHLTSATWYPDFAKFSRYETDMRGYVDLATIIDRAAVVGLEGSGLDNFKDRFTRHLVMRHLGLTNLKALTFHLGFEGKYQRSTVCLGIEQPQHRTGLMALVSGPIANDLNKLPPIPPDADYVSVRHVDWGNVHDYIRESYAMIAAAKLFSNGELPARLPDLNRMIGGDFRKDLLDQLDSAVVTYGAHSEGPFFLGQAFAVKVKDADRVRKSLNALAKSLGEMEPTLAGEKKMFRGHEMFVFGKSYLPLTYTIHKDWLVVGLYPQPVQGFLLRSGGKYRTWKAPPELAEAFAKERKENGKGKLLAMSVSDPRPIIEIGLALMPAYFQTINASLGGSAFDVSKIPNAQAVNEWLFPNVMLLYDDGHTLRWENHYSINEPDDFLHLTWFSSAISYLPFARFYPVPPMMPQPVPAPAIPAAPVPAPKMAELCPAKAVEKDGAVQIQITKTRKVEYTVTKNVPLTVEEKVVVGGKEQTVKIVVYKPVTETVFKNVLETSVLIPDGKKVIVTRKDGKAVDPKDLPRLLEKETPVLVVSDMKISDEQLQRLDDNTLIIRIAPTDPEKAPELPPNAK